MADDDKGDEVWEENWEDDNIEDDFTLQLRAELEKKVILHLPWDLKFWISGFESKILAFGNEIWDGNRKSLS